MKKNRHFKQGSVLPSEMTDFIFGGVCILLGLGILFGYSAVTKMNVKDMLGDDTLKLKAQREIMTALNSPSGEGTIADKIISSSHDNKLLDREAALMKPFLKNGGVMIETRGQEFGVNADNPSSVHRLYSDMPEIYLPAPDGSVIRMRTFRFAQREPDIGYVMTG